MLVLPLIVALFGADPTPEPSPVPAAAKAPAAATGAPTPLTEIGRVKGRTICTSIVVHANAAIDGALDNDRTIALTIARLSTLDLDSENDFNRRKQLADLDKIASQLRIQSLNGEGEVRRLRELAAASADPERKKELKDFADALGGAMFRQRRVAMDLQRMTAIMNGRRAVDDAADELMTPGQRLARSMEGPRHLAPERVRSGHENETLRSAASELSERLPLIAADEGLAADHSIGATTGC